MKTSEATDAINTAMAAVQAKIEGAKKDSNNPHFNKKYADLESCWCACRAALTENHIAVIQAPVKNDRGAEIQTRLAHKSGQWIEDDGLFIPADRANAHGYGSAMTYARRYALCAMVGICPEDDDGNSAADNPPPPKAEKKPAPPAKKQAEKPAPPPSSTIDIFRDFFSRADTPGKEDMARDWIHKSGGEDKSYCLDEWYQKATASADAARLDQLEKLAHEDRQYMADREFMKIGPRIDGRREALKA